MNKSEASLLLRMDMILTDVSKIHLKMTEALLPELTGTLKEAKFKEAGAYLVLLKESVSMFENTLNEINKE